MAQVMGNGRMADWTEHERWETPDGERAAEQVDWAAACRLALVVSILAAASALLLSGLVGETVLVVAVIVAGTAASWFHLEHGRLSRPATVRPIPVHHDLRR